MKKENKENWARQFTEEFGIHFKRSSGELQFALEFIRTLLAQERQKAKEETIKEIEELLPPESELDTIFEKGRDNAIKEIKAKIKSKLKRG